MSNEVLLRSIAEILKDERKRTDKVADKVNALDGTTILKSCIGVLLDGHVQAAQRHLLQITDKKAELLSGTPSALVQKVLKA